jgi:hypothetical protein
VRVVAVSDGSPANGLMTRNGRYTYREYECQNSGFPDDLSSRY